MGLLSRLFGQKQAASTGSKPKSSEVNQELQKQRSSTEMCCSILKQCQTRNQVLEGFGKVAQLLKQAHDPLGESAAKIYKEAGALPDEYLFKLRDDFISQCHAFLSTTKPAKGEPIQQTQNQSMKTAKPEKKKIDGLKSTPKGKINKVEVCFNAAHAPYTETEVLNDLINHFVLAPQFAPNVHITTCYGSIRSDPAMFVTARSMITGFDVNKVSFCTFKVDNVSGVIILQGE